MNQDDLYLAALDQYDSAIQRNRRELVRNTAATLLAVAAFVTLGSHKLTILRKNPYS